MKTIAVVEDNADNRLLVSTLLDGLYDIVEYDNGADALEGMRRSRPDLALLDISLPQMDGTEVLRRLRADPSLADLPVVALTAHAMAGDRERYLRTGFNGYVSKPILDDEAFLAVIRRCLGDGPV